MRKLIIAFILVLCCNITFTYAGYIVQTDDGAKEVVVPDDYTETEVMLDIATEYYNLEKKYNELLEVAKDLAEKSKSYQESTEKLRKQIEEQTKETEEYIEQNKQLREKYDNLIKDYELLATQYEQKLRRQAVRGLLGANAGFKSESTGVNLDNIGITGGILLFDKVGITASINYLTSKNLGFGAGFLVVL